MCTNFKTFPSWYTNKHVHRCRFYEIQRRSDHQETTTLGLLCWKSFKDRNCYHIAVCQRLMKAARGTYRQILKFPTVLEVTEYYEWLVQGQKPNLMKLLSWRRLRSSYVRHDCAASIELQDFYILQIQNQCFLTNNTTGAKKKASWSSEG